MPNASKTITILVEAQDHASKALSGVASSIGSIGKVAGGLALGGAVAGVGALGAVLVKGIGDARDANAVLAQTQNVIKSTGGAAGFSAQQISDMAGSLSAASGKSLFGDDDIQRGQNMLLTFTNITDKLPDTTQAMIDLSQATGQDMQSSALQLGKSLNDPIKGVSALQRVGVSFTAQQKKQIATMQKAGDVAGAQGVILAELNKEFGGSAAAAAEADGGFAQFSDSLGELGESIGQKVLPMFTPLMATLNTVINQIASGDWQGALGTITTALGTFATTVGTWIGEQAPIWAAQLLAWGEAFIAWVAPMIPPLLAKLGEAALGIGQWIAEQAPGWAAQLLAWGEAFLTWIEPMIPPLLAQLGQIALGIGQWIGEQAAIWAPQLLAWGEAFLTWVEPMIPPLIAQLGQIASGLLAWIGEQAAPIVAQLQAWGQAFIAWIGPATTTFLAQWPGFLSRFLDWIGSAAGPLLAKLGDWAVQFVAWIIPMIPGFVATLAKIAAALIVFVAETVGVLVPKLLEWAAAFIDWIATSVIPKLAPALGEMLTTIGQWITGTAVPWLVSEAGKLAKAIIDGVTNWLNSSGGQITTAIETVFNSAMKRAEEIVNGAIENILGFIKHAIDRIQALIDWIGRVNGLHVQTPAPGPSGGGGNNSKSAPVPSFASGVTNFGGGLAYVHAGEVLMNLSRGTSVIPAREAVGPGNVTIGAIHIHQQPGESADAIARRVVATIERDGIGLLRQARGRGLR